MDGTIRRLFTGGLGPTEKTLHDVIGGIENSLNNVNEYEQWKQANITVAVRTLVVHLKAGQELEERGYPVEGIDTATFKKYRARLGIYGVHSPVTIYKKEGKFPEGDETSSFLPEVILEEDKKEILEKYKTALKDILEEFKRDFETESRAQQAGPSVTQAPGGSGDQPPRITSPTFWAATGAAGVKASTSLLDQGATTTSLFDQRATMTRRSRAP